MKKNFFKLALLICAITVLSLAISLTALAYSSGTCGDNLTWALDDNGTLTISGSGAMFDYGYSSNYAPWHTLRSNISAVKIEDGVTSIGDRAFQNCINLTNITIPNSITALGSHTFQSCTNLKNIAIPNGVIKIEDYAFSECKNLKSVTIPDSVTSIGNYAFYSCTSLTSITISGVTSLGDHAFSGCTSLTSITIPEKMTSIGIYAFCNCTNLEEINWNAKNITKFSSGNHIFDNAGKTNGIAVTFGDEVEKIPAYLFHPGSTSSMSSITSVVMGNSVTSIGESAFYNASNLASITIPDSVIEIEDSAFNNCTSLTSITINGVTSIGDYAFRGCSSLTSITIPKEMASIGIYAFYNCTNLEEINWNAKKLSDFSSGNNIFGNAGRNANGIVVTFGDNVEKIPAYLFYPSTSSDSFPNVKSVTIESNITLIGKYAFYNCINLEEINWNAKNMTDFSSGNNIFGNTGKNTNGIVVTFGDEVERIPEYLFCADSIDSSPNISSVTIGKSVTSIGSKAFGNCASLTSITIPDNVLSIGSSAFQSCTSLRNITLPFIGESRETNGTADAVFGYVFGNEIGIKTKQYYSATGYTTYSIPSSLKRVIITDADIVPYGSFYGCNNLDNVTLNRGIDTIYSNSFCNCSNLLEVTILSQPVKISNSNIFEGCDMLTIHGFEGSDVEEYATKYGIDFEPINENTEGVATLTASAEVIAGNIVITATAVGSTTEKFIPVAVYDSDNMMLDLIIIPTNEDFEVIKIVFKDIKDAAFVKLFIWDSYDNLVPLETAKEVTINRE